MSLSTLRHPEKKVPDIRRLDAPVVPLIRPEKKKLRRDELISLNLRTNPRDENSETYELNVPFFSSGTPSEWLDFHKLLKEVIRGQNLTTGAQKCTTWR